MNYSRRVLYFDCISGASGDMIVGSLLDLGLDLEELRSELAKLALQGYRIEAEKIVTYGLSATKFYVLGVDDQPVDLSPGNDEHHRHNHLNMNDFRRCADQIPDRHHHHQDKNAHVHRGLRDIVHIIKQSGLAAEVKEKSIKVFYNLAVAEAKIHGTRPEEVHFHEVGAVDSIVDIVAAVVGLNLLKIDRIVVSPLPLGKGFVHCQHGIIPVPAPATMELLVGMETYGSDHNGETVTPTGAAILATLAKECGSMPRLKVINVGYGSGTRDFGVPNVLRTVLGQEESVLLGAEN